ncbi:hypothetical protein MMC26_000262 [Xylographa opegraphella]|nr:hypothetical protein [Xylographa opegraphella]
MSRDRQVREAVAAMLAERPSNISHHNWAHMTLIERFPTTMFRHSPLNPQMHDFRLLTLLPGGRDDTIKCTLTEACLRDSLRYEALSYTWAGEPGGFPMIEVNGLQFPVSPNLHLALSHLRSEVVDRVLWIDAISIDQLNDKEKGGQIQMMGEIYKGASRVLVWLGQAAEDSDLAMSLIPKINTITLDDVPFSIEDDEKRKAWDALLRLFRRPWWTRCWVIQEIAAASSDPLVGCGKVWLDWSRFAHAVNLMSGSVSERVLQTASPTFTLMQIVRDDKTHRIQDLLKYSVQFAATEAQDMVFSLLGLVNDDDRSALKLDYSKSVRQVFTEVAKHLLRNDINVLCFYTNSSCHDLPSWVPDWSRFQARWPLWMPGMYRAGSAQSRKIRFIGDGLTLMAEGILMDQIEHVDTKSRLTLSSSPDTDSTPEEVVDNIEALLETVKQLPASKRKLLDPQRSDALWRTLVTNRLLLGRAHTMGSEIAPQKLGKMFEVFRNRSPVPAFFHPQMPQQQRKQEYIKEFVQSMQLGDQRFFVTADGRMGIGPHALRKDDVLAIIFGADMPFVFRARGESYQLIGCSYVDGVMNGELFKSKMHGKRTFVIR